MGAWEKAAGLLGNVSRNRVVRWGTLTIAVLGGVVLYLGVPVLRQYGAPLGLTKLIKEATGNALPFGPSPAELIAIAKQVHAAVLVVFVPLFLERLRLIAHALWIARVSTISTAVGIVLFAFVPQAQDLFLELKWNPDNPDSPWHIGWFYWPLFYVLTLICWAVPVHFSARLALQSQTLAGRIDVENKAEYNLIVVWLPRALSALCLFAITIGIWTAQSTLHAAFSDVATRPPLFRPIEDRLQNRLLAAIGLSLLLPALFAIPPKLQFFQKLEQVLPSVHARLTQILDWLCEPNKRQRARDQEWSRPELPSPTEAVRHFNIMVAVTFVLICLILIYLCVLLLVPFEWMRDYLPGAIFVPILLGCFVPLLAMLSVLSHRVRLPCVLIGFGAIALITWLKPTWHDLTCAPSDCSRVAAPRKIPIGKAVVTWMEANDCTGRPNQCPRPIVIAADGGASRAAFFTGSVLARLEDQTRERFKEAPTEWFSRRVFAISAVSGSALGAATFSTALREIDEVKRESPGKASEKEYVDRHPWFCNWWYCFQHAIDRREPGKVSARIGRIETYVQQVISGDFLTAPVMGLAFYDLLRITGKGRARLLEEAWSNQVREVFGRSDEYSSAVPFSALSPSDASRWRPFLVMNGTAVDDGRRIITTNLDIRSNGDDAGGRGSSSMGFGVSHDFYALMCKSSQPPNGTSKSSKEPACTCDGQNLPSCDIPVSTAIMNAARFPVVTPPGNVRLPKSDAPNVQLIVDGGYYEVFGVSSAVEIARAIKKAVPELDPYVLQLTNDPAAFPEPCGWAETARKSDADAGKFLGILRHPLEAVLNSRTARGYEAKRLAENWTQISTTRGPGSGQHAYAHVRVCGKSDVELSMSWWLSMPVQQYLHDQVKANEDVLTCVLGQTSRDANIRSKWPNACVLESVAKTQAGSKS